MSKPNNLIALVLAIVLLIIVVLPILLLDRFANEDRDYKLSKEMHRLGKELREYKKQNGKYPETILQIRNSDKLCVNHFYTKCRQIFYKPSNDFQDFKMAVHSFTWLVLYYDPERFMTAEEESQLSQQAREKLYKKYGVICLDHFFCPTDEKDYRKDRKKFSNPDEWPIL
ncbi:MAG: hypothetical protein AAB583_05285 [Patescibacteria group bacterium]